MHLFLLIWTNFFILKHSTRQWKLRRKICIPLLQCVHFIQFLWARINFRPTTDDKHVMGFSAVQHTGLWCTWCCAMSMSTCQQIGLFTVAVSAKCCSLCQRNNKLDTWYWLSNISAVVAHRALQINNSSTSGHSSLHQISNGRQPI